MASIFLLSCSIFVYSNVTIVTVGGALSFAIFERLAKVFYR